MTNCLEPTNCPNNDSGMPCNECAKGIDTDSLFTLIREAIEACQHEQFYRGRYSAGANDDYTPPSASDACVKMWRALYDFHSDN
jgi:hypothetical protein